MTTTSYPESNGDMALSHIQILVGSFLQFPFRHYIRIEGKAIIKESTLLVRECTIIVRVLGWDNAN